MLQGVALAVTGVREWRLTDGSALVFNVDVSGSRTVWSEMTDAGTRVGLHDSNTGTHKTIASSSDGFLLASISGTKVVWISMQSYDSASVYLYDVVTGERKRLSASALPALPAVSGDYVVWPGAVTETSSQIFLHRISTGVTTKITTTNTMKVSPAVGGDKIVWLEPDGLYDSATVKAYDIPTATESALTGTPVDTWGAPSTDGQTVVWSQADANWQQDVFAYIFADSSTRRITNSSRNESEPKVDNGRIVWADEMYDESSGDIYLYDMATKVVRRVTDNPTPQFSPDISGNRLVWIDERYGDGMTTDAMLADISGLDTKRPVARMITAAYSTAASKTGTFKVSWAATDPAPSEGGIATYDVQVKTGAGGTWRNLRLGTTDRYAYISGTPGRTYYFRARARDKAGILGEWSPVRSTVVPFDDRAATGTNGFAGLYANASSPNFLGTLTYSRNTSDAIEFTFRGNRVALLAVRGPGQSEADIYIDDVYQGRIDTLASSLRYRQIVYARAFPSIGTHKIRVVNVGTAGRRRLDIDGFGVSN